VAPVLERADVVHPAPEGALREQNEKREGSRVVKERLVKEAEELADSTEWGPTAGRYRDLMRQWKAAGPAPKDVDDELWRRFRAAQDTFFGARDATNAALDAEYAANAETKEKLLVEAEALLPVTDLDAAKRALRSIADRWEAAGKVPRERIKELEGRMRAVEQAVRSVEDDQWRAPTRRSPPAPTTWSPSSRPRSPRSRPTSPRPARPATRRRSRSSRRTSLPASPSSTWPAASPPTTPTDADPSLLVHE
jgi:hypothetical protein